MTGCSPSLCPYWWRWRLLFAVLFSLVGGLRGPHMVVIGVLVPYLLLVGIPVLIRSTGSVSEVHLDSRSE